MKSKKKVLVTLLCAVLLVFASVMGTMAYLQSEDSVKNTFTVGNVKIVLDETDVDGSKTEVTTDGRDKENAYKLIPGTEYDKDPIVHVDSNSENCYVFVKVTNDIADIEADTKIAAQMANNGWSELADYPGVYYYNPNGNAIVAGGSDLTVFEHFTISNAISKEELAGYTGKTIKVVAYAVQAEGFEEGGAAAAWGAAKDKFTL